MSRWQLAVADLERDPLSPWYGEPKTYQVTAPERGALTLLPSRVIRFLGAPLADLPFAGTLLTAFVGVAPDTLSFTFHPLWQRDAAITAQLSAYAAAMNGQ